eukprot:jgi/Chrzof1/8578/Cz03g16060.t1
MAVVNRALNGSHFHSSVVAQEGSDPQQDILGIGKKEGMVTGTAADGPQGDTYYATPEYPPNTSDEVEHAASRSGSGDAGGSGSQRSSSSSTGASTGEQQEQEQEDQGSRQEGSAGGAAAGGFQPGTPKEPVKPRVFVEKGEQPVAPSQAKSENGTVVDKGVTDNTMDIPGAQGGG